MRNNTKLNVSCQQIILIILLTPSLRKRTLCPHTITHKDVLLHSNNSEYTSDYLEQVVKSPVELRRSLIEGFLFEHSALMVYADDGIGKSTLLLQAVCQASCGENVFSGLVVTRPLRVLWIMAERHPDEIMERLRHMSKSTNINYQNIFIDSKLQGTNLLKESSRERAITRLDEIAKTFGAFDIMVIDPIYAMVEGGMTDDVSVSSITRFSTFIQNRYNCSDIMVHHTNRGGRNTDGQRTSGDMYGSRFLSAHFTGMYHIKKTVDGTTLYLQKNSHSNLLSKIPLEFDPETYLSSMNETDLTKLDTVLNYLRSCRNGSKQFTFKDIQSNCDVSTQYLYKVFSRDYKTAIKWTGKYLHRMKLYTVLDV